jgi:hypothetical protein
VERARDVREKKAVTKTKSASKAGVAGKGGKVKVAASTKANGPRAGTSKMKVGRKKTA